MLIHSLKSTRIARHSKILFSSGTPNDSGKILLSIAESNNLFVGTRLRKNRRMDKITWIGNTKLSQKLKVSRKIPRIVGRLDYIKVSKEMKNGIPSHKEIWKTPFTSNHGFLVLTLKLSLTRCKHKQANISVPKVRSAAS